MGLARREALLRPAFLFLLLLSLSPLLMPTAATTPRDRTVEEIGWGLWVGQDGGGLVPRSPQVTLCVQAAASVQLRLDTASERHPGYRFEPQPGRPHCRSVMGGFLMHAETAAGEVRILVTRVPPQELERPARVILPTAGEALVVPSGSAGSRLRVTDGAASGLAVYTWDRLVPVPFEDGALAPEGAVVVLVMEEEAAGAMIAWSDPAWIDRAPRLGAVLAVVAVALLLTLYRGTPGRSFVRPPPRRPLG